jgi:Tfp pilus assembly protein FimT
MVRVSPKMNSQSGASLVELMVVALIIAIVATIALFNGNSANPRYQRQNASRMLKAALERARFDSVKRRAVNGNAMAKVVVTSTSFTLHTDANLNGLTTDSGDGSTTIFATGITMRRLDGAAFSSGVNDTITFNMRGEVPASPVAQFVVCNGTCPDNASLTSDMSDVLVVTPTGTVNLLAGGPNVVPTFNTPSVAGSTSNTAGIDPDVTVP